MIPVTAADVRRWSKVPLDQLVGPAPGGEESESGESDPLAEEVERAAAMLMLQVGWFYNPDWLPPEQIFLRNPQLWIVPRIREPLMRQCIQMAVEWESYRHQPDAIEGIIDYDVVESFTTKGYSEVRRGSGRGAVSVISINRTSLHPWPALDKLMFDLQNPIMSQGDVPQVRAPGMQGSLAIRWDQGRYVIDAGRPGAEQVYMANGPSAPYSVYDERPGGMWFVPGFAEQMWPN